jgi:hypothetical protein
LTLGMSHLWLRLNIDSFFDNVCELDLVFNFYKVLLSFAPSLYLILNRHLRSTQFWTRSSWQARSRRRVRTWYWRDWTSWRSSNRTWTLLYYHTRSILDSLSAYIHNPGTISTSKQGNMWIHQMGNNSKKRCYRYTLMKKKIDERAERRELKQHPRARSNLLEELLDDPIFVHVRDVCPAVVQPAEDVDLSHPSAP